MTSFAKVIEHSISPQGIELLTVHARYWRPIHSELMTHRVLSKNARSSRAVPSITLLNEPPFIPRFGMNQPGMQSEILASPELQGKWSREWLELSEITRLYVERWSIEGMHKQHANRPLEWFGWIDTLITGSGDWNNFFGLRISEYAQPEFDQLARLIKHARNESTPKLLQPGEWHLPYVTEEERAFAKSDIHWEWDLDTLRRISTARCARLSYKPFDGNSDIDAEIARHDKLVVSQPVHASPAEHQATPDCVVEDPRGYTAWARPELHGNLRGWCQYRKMLPNEFIPG